MSFLVLNDIQMDFMKGNGNSGFEGMKWKLMRRKRFHGL